MPCRTDTAPELLAPAGSPEALHAAIEGGADAVYFGAVKFSARMRARNFAEGELSDAIALCRAHNIRSYITVNTRVRDAEIAPLLDTVSVLNAAGADALIIADLGTIRAVRETFPDLPLHASTQLSGVSSADAATLAALGISRMVCPRELSLSQITELCERSPIEIEMFIHGAHCVSYSGQCMFSYAMGGRSGNRGECAQPCRLPYTVADCAGASRSPYPLSLKDMCLAGHIREILLSGVRSLKIEGRQKSPEYVFGVTRMYRTLLDEGRDATPDEIASLAALFSRDGFSDGYFRRAYKGMLGVRRAEDTEMSRTAVPFAGLTKRVPIKAHLTVQPETPITLSLTAHGKTVTVSGAIPSAARTIPLTEESARRNIEKFGNTPYVSTSFRADIADGLFATPAQLNALRREATEALNAPPVRRGPLAAVYESTGFLPPAKPIFTAEFLTPGQISPEAESFFDEIYLPLHCRTKGYGVTLPEYAPDGRMGQIRAALSLAAPSTLIAHTPAELALAREHGIPSVASLRLNVFNGRSAREVLSLGAACVTPSPELPLGAIRAIGVPKSVIVYGRIPLMMMLRCAISDGGTACPFHGAGGFTETDGDVKKTHLCMASMKDRTGAAFPTVGMYDCTNVLYNSVPIYMADKQETLSSLGAARWHFQFTAETRDEVNEIIRAYRERRAPTDARAIRRLK